jgi:hypothetical protein
LPKIAQLLVVVEKLSFFLASILFKLVILYGIPRMGRNFDDYPGFQQKTTHAN